MSASIAEQQQRLLTPAQLAERWSVSVGHLANLRSLGRGPSYLALGRIRYALGDVIAYEDAARRQVGAAA